MSDARPLRRGVLATPAADGDPKAKMVGRTCPCCGTHLRECPHCGLVIRHARREGQKKHIGPDGTWCVNTMPHSAAAERFWEKVDKTEACWNWVGSVSQGYGQFGFRRSTERAHRFSYELLVGAIPAGLHLDHTCRNRRCVNPAHLEPVTPAENHARVPVEIKRSSSFQARQTHCKHGHPFDAANTYVSSDGHRACRECGRRHARNHARAKRAPTLLTEAPR